MGRVLSADFFMQDDVLAISQALLGKHLYSKVGGVTTSGIIVETEAYRAPEDKASHAYGNRRTKRTATMFLPGGICYVYLCYGIHHLFNVVTGAAEKAHAILIRALEPCVGIEVMQSRRQQHRKPDELTSGPGKLSQALDITMQQNGQLLDGSQHIWIEDHGQVIDPEHIIRSPRVGVDYAEECAAWNWRFRIKDNSWTSKPD
ncbi:MAG: DNA-3-methyladenine glycosylase [Saprospiraceae bacterium]|nr:DNA-3-methyladenine glycosylase [Saprospiraceae bacterium]